MNILFVSPYFNNSHFIEIQVASFKKYLKNCTWTLLIIDDSTSNTKNTLTNKLENIKDECDKHECVMYTKFPQNQHSSKTNGYIRHREILTYMMTHVYTNYRQQYDYMASFDADMCFIQDFDTEKELTGYDILGPKRIQWLGNIQCDSKYPIFDYLFVHCMFINMNTVINFNEINMDSIPNTTCDSGSMIIKFLMENNYNVKYWEFSTGSEIVDEPYYFEFFHNNKIIHFSTSSLWQQEKERYMKNSHINLVELFKSFVVNGFSYTDFVNIQTNKLQKYGEKHKIFTGRYMTLQELLEHLE
jgi:hypothetical protein